MGSGDETTGGEERYAVPSDDHRNETLAGPGSLPRDPGAIEDLIAERRADLAATIDELVVRVHPKEVARRSVAGVRGRLESFATTSEGELRTERVAAVAAAVVALVGLLFLRRGHRCRSR